MGDFIKSLFSVEGKSALVTGGTRGIGQSLAFALAAAGADIILLQRESSKRETAQDIEALGRKATIVECDLSDKQSLSKIVDKITAPANEGGLGLPIDILVNCGGIQRRSPSAYFSDSDWDEVIQVNLSAVWTLSRDVGRYMISRYEQAGEKVSQLGRGKIITISSLLSFQGGLTVPAYASTKHAVVGMTKALSNEWSSKNINVNTIAPGYIATDMNTALQSDPVRSKQILERIPIGRWGMPSDFEGIVVFLASKASDYVCGETIVVDGGWMGR